MFHIKVCIIIIVVYFIISYFIVIILYFMKFQNEYSKELISERTRGSSLTMSTVKVQSHCYCSVVGIPLESTTVIALKRQESDVCSNLGVLMDESPVS